MEELRSVSVESQRLPPKTALCCSTPPFKTRPTLLGSRFVLAGKESGGAAFRFRRKPKASAENCTLLLHSSFQNATHFVGLAFCIRDFFYSFIFFDNNSSRNSFYVIINYKNKTFSKRGEYSEKTESIYSSGSCCFYVRRSAPRLRTRRWRSESRDAGRNNGVCRANRGRRDKRGRNARNARRADGAGGGAAVFMVRCGGGGVYYYLCHRAQGVCASHPWKCYA